MTRTLLTAAGVLSTALLVQGCMVPIKPYVPPVDVPLQDPTPGNCIVYLLRAPYDSSKIAVFLKNRKLVSLPSSTYSAITLAPGQYTLETYSDSIFGKDIEAAQPFLFLAKADERRFLNISGITEKARAFAGVLPIGATPTPIFISRMDTTDGTRTWKEVSELDAQGLMSISKPVMPEKGVL